MLASVPVYIPGTPSTFAREDGPEEGMTAVAQSTSSLETLISLPGCLPLAPAVYKPDSVAFMELVTAVFQGAEARLLFLFSLSL